MQMGILYPDLLETTKKRCLRMYFPFKDAATNLSDAQ